MPCSLYLLPTTFIAILLGFLPGSLSFPGVDSRWGIWLCPGNSSACCFQDGLLYVHTYHDRSRVAPGLPTLPSLMVITFWKELPKTLSHWRCRKESGIIIQFSQPVIGIEKKMWNYGYITILSKNQMSNCTDPTEQSPRKC